MAAKIRLRSLGRSCGRGGRKTESSAYLHKKILCGIKVSELGGHRSSDWCAMDGNGLSAAGRLPCHAGRTHTAIMGYTKNKLVELIKEKTNLMPLILLFYSMLIQCSTCFGR